MGYFLLRLIILVLRFFKFVGDGTIWLFKKLLLSGLFILKSLVLISKLPFKIISSVIFFTGYFIEKLSAGIKSIQIPTITYKKKNIFAGFIRNKQNVERVKEILPSNQSLSISKAIKFFMFGFGLASIILGSFSLYYLLSKDLPHPLLLTERDIPLTTKILDRNNELLYEIYSDQNRTSVPLEELSDHFINATIAIEDQGFYQHQGFSPRGIVRAAYSIVIHDEIQGGSTITQQLVRSALLSRETTLLRKARELILSVWSEQIYTKEEILSMYFTQVPYGGTAWGAEAAAQTYFGKSIRDVNLAEAALLAGLPAAPTTFSPYGSHPELATIRQKEVLRRMEEEGFITKTERDEAENEALVFAPERTGIRAPHFVMYVRQVLSEKYGPRMTEQGGLIVHTSLDLEIQEKAQKIVTKEVAALENLQVGNGAAIITDPKNGEILSMVGSIDYFNTEKNGNVNVVLSQQQPGSTIKVVTYTAALINGYTAASLLNDSPITYTAQGASPYSPVNYDGKFHGLIPLRYALGNSFNIPAVRTLADVSIPAMIEVGQKMGIDSWKDPNAYGLSLTLGGGEVTMLDMAEVYGTLANDGKLFELTPIVYITDHLGNIIEDNRNRTPNEVIPEGISYIVSDILSDNSARTTAFGPTSQLSIPDNWVAVKTGTSNDKRDNWAIGYTKDFVVVTWVGNNNNSPMSNIVSGITGATPEWRSITDFMLTKFPSIKPIPPASVTAMPCRGKTEYFIKGTEPAGGCRPIPTPTPTPEENKESENEETN